MSEQALYRKNIDDNYRPNRFEAPETWVKKRIEKLRNSNASTFNKLELVGGSYSDFFAPDQPIFPGHNSASFRMDDIRPYLDVEYALSKGLRNDITSKILVTDLILTNYFQKTEELQNAFNEAGIDGALKILQDATDKRHDIFYKENNEEMYSIKEVGIGATCTERVAMAHNLLSLLNVPNIYCVDEFHRAGNDIDNSSEAHNSTKHSFIVLKDQSKNFTYLYDPNDYSCIGDSMETAKRQPLLFPIKKVGVQIIDNQLVIKETMTKLTQIYSLEYKISDLSKVLLQLQQFSAIRNK
jgi:hypothetical protein